MSKQTTFHKVNVLGVEIDAVTIKQAVSYIINRSGQHDAPAMYIIKPYVEFIDKAYKNRRVKALLNNAELAIADGVALTWAAHFLYAGDRTASRFWRTLFKIVFKPLKLNNPLPQRAAGVNFTWPLLEAAEQADRSIFLIGHPQDSDISHTKAVITRRLPDINIVGVLDGRDPASNPGQISPEWMKSTVTEIRQANPDIVLIGMGFPLQETVAAGIAPHLHHGVLVGEGGTFDYESFGGRRRRAPSTMQRLGLEWFWRLLLQPSRILRHLAIPRFILRVWLWRNKARSDS